MCRQSQWQQSGLPAFPSSHQLLMKGLMLGLYWLFCLDELQNLAVFYHAGTLKQNVIKIKCSPHALMVLSKLVGMDTKVDRKQVCEPWGWHSGGTIQFLCQEMHSLEFYLKNKSEEHHHFSAFFLCSVVTQPKTMNVCLLFVCKSSALSPLFYSLHSFWLWD